MANWAAMLRALVTTVSVACGDASMMSALAPSTPAIAVLVVPPQSQTTVPRLTRALAARAIWSFCGAFCSRL
jgi:hypothetical protein